MMYFGYYGNGYQGFSGDPKTIMAATAGYSNLLWLEPYMPPSPYAFDMLKDAQTMGWKAIIYVGSLVLDNPTTVAENAETKLREWWATLTPYHDVIEALLIADEPWRRNENSGAPKPSIDVTHALERAAAYVYKVTKKKTIVSASGQEFTKNQIPLMVDWLAMYRYSHNTSWPELLYSAFILISRKAAHQKIIAVADAFTPNGKPVDQTRIKKFNSWWKFIVRQYSREFVAVAPFLYQSGPFGIGADNMLMVQADLAAWSNELRAVS